MNAKIIYGTAWCVAYIKTGPVYPSISGRKKERTAALVVSAVLAGFRAIDTGWLSSILHAAS
jgi:hypothetical protein